MVLKSYEIEGRFSPVKSYEIDTSIFDLEVIIKMQKNAEIIIQDFEKKTADTKKTKLLFSDLESKIYLCTKSLNEKVLDLDRRGVFWFACNWEFGW